MADQILTHPVAEEKGEYAGKGNLPHAQLRSDRDDILYANVARGITQARVVNF